MSINAMSTRERRIVKFTIFFQLGQVILRMLMVNKTLRLTCKFIITLFVTLVKSNNTESTKLSLFWLKNKCKL